MYKCTCQMIVHVWVQRRAYITSKVMVRNEVLHDEDKLMSEGKE